MSTDKTTEPQRSDTQSAKPFSASTTGSSTPYEAGFIAGWQAAWISIQFALKDR